MPDSLLSPSRLTLPAAERAFERSPTKRPLRLALWEIEGSLQCSIIGTCLSDQDLLTTVRKHRLQIDRNAHSYDVHSYCVRAASEDCALARSLTKLLEQRFAGAIRLMGRAKTDEEVRLVWERLRDGGQIAGGYWAVMSHTHLAASFKTRVFGEVHMLSHLHGQGASQLANRLKQAELRCANLESRLRRSETAKVEALAARDAARVHSSRREHADQGQATAPVWDHASEPDRALRRLQQKLAKCERAVIVARARARQAETELSRLSAARPPMRNLAAHDIRTRFVSGHQPRRSPTPHRVLYLGGRTAIVPHLRTAAAARVAAFFHHDGGIEDSLHRIEEMIAGCDAVVCPVDCVSHGACRMAKAICQRLNRRFLPIATASRSGFERALDQLLATTHQGHEENLDRNQCS
ncbi:MAG TPA: DUF2325 domain-containing protein [Hyphomicrobiaceae bacterium]|nr:DUF2325 domain-containing protein [Hyphomicrobiaceae bacterium]